MQVKVLIDNHDINGFSKTLVVWGSISCSMKKGYPNMTGTCWLSAAHIVLARVACCLLSVMHPALPPEATPPMQPMVTTFLSEIVSPTPPLKATEPKWLTTPFETLQV